MCFFGVGNHGGGPTRANIESINRLAPGSDIDVVFSSPETFFQEVAQETAALPVVRDELQHHASGCYAAHSAVKRCNRRAALKTRRRVRARNRLVRLPLST